VTYASPNRSVTLRLTGGGANRLDDLVLDRLASSGGWRPATVAGKPAVLSTYDAPPDTGSVAKTLMWAHGDGVVAELTAQGLTEAELEAAAASIHEVDAPGWDALVARYGPRTVPSAAPGTGSDQLAEVTVAICQLQARWLSAEAAGDHGAEAAAVEELGNVLDKGRATGLGADSDILVVAERLLDAMASRDLAAIRAIPEGGACS